MLQATEGRSDCQPGMTEIHVTQARACTIGQTDGKLSHMKVEAPDGWVPVTSACQDNPDLWFSDNDRDKIEAKLICLECPLKVACKSTAIDNREKHGIWGGTDFSNYRLPKLQNVMCRKGKHKLPEVRENNQCQECRRDTQKDWEARQARERTPHYLKKLKSNKDNSTRPKNVIGGKCKNGHDVVPGNIIIRSGDGAILCKACTHGTKVKDVHSGEVINENMGSRNNGQNRRW